MNKLDLRILGGRPAEVDGAAACGRRRRARSDFVQRLQIARRELALESTLAKLDKYRLLILDDIVYVSKDQAETGVLFELNGTRYERRSMLITANQPFGEWGKVFPDQAITLAAIDRLVHHSTIFEMNVESYRRRALLDRKRGPGRQPTTMVWRRFALYLKRSTRLVLALQSVCAGARRSRRHV